MTFSPVTWSPSKALCFRVPDRSLNIGLVLAGTARDAMVAALSVAGYEVHIAATIDRVRTLIARDAVDAWIFDARAEDVLDLLLPTGRFLLPADNIPDAEAGASFRNWVEGLLTQLGVALSGGAAPAQYHSRDPSTWTRHSSSCCRALRCKTGSSRCALPRVCRCCNRPGW